MTSSSERQDPGLQEAAKRVLQRFVLPGEVSGFEVILRGHINDTFKVTAGGASFALQRLNQQVFRDPELVLRNRLQLQQHLPLADVALVPPLVPLRKGGWWWQEPQGDAAGWWRLCPWIAGACHDQLPDLATARAAGAGLARFHRAASRVPLDEVTEPIPGFMDLRLRLAQLQHAVQANVRGRLDAVQPELLLIRQHEHLVSALDGAPQQVIHGDCKVNNLVFAVTGTDASLLTAMLDLDTLMPGAVVLDLADLLRSATAGQAEDSQAGAVSGASTGMREDVFGCLLAGYAAELEPTNWQLLAPQVLPAMAQVTLMLAVRFLTDYLQGDRYFRPTRADQNLHRCRQCLTQLQALDQRATVLRRLVLAAAA